MTSFEMSLVMADSRSNNIIPPSKPQQRSGALIPSILLFEKNSRKNGAFVSGFSRTFEILTLAFDYYLVRKKHIRSRNGVY